ncbi:VanW family protein [Patescibacteria group bacterium]|nr:VanW family protein [Patescibacteria group bacterium]
MTQPDKTNQVRFFKLNWLIFYGLIGLFLVLIVGLFVYRQASINTIFPHVMFGSVNLGGLSQTEAEESLNKAWDKIAKQGVTVGYGEKKVVVTSLVSSPTDPDLTYELVSFKPQVAAALAWQVGRQGNWFKKMVEPAIVGWRTFDLSSSSLVEVKIDRVLEFLRSNLSDLEKDTKPASFLVDEADKITILPEQSGWQIEAVKLEKDLSQAFLSLSSREVLLNLKPSQPDIIEQDLIALLPKAKEFLIDQPLTFSFKTEEFVVPPTLWHKWLGVKQEEDLIISLLPQIDDEFWLRLAKKINQPAQDAKFEIVDNRVRAFQAAQTGQELDMVKTWQLASTALLNKQLLPLALAVKVTQPKVVTAATNDLGIAELIGVGRSNFAGSPKNRRHNIKVGADSLNGILIKSGEEFSLISALGSIDGDNGYLQELVIKGNKTIPEYGGGLCQIGTTTFRTALASGLPIVERRNHSYRVSYYEPAGTDATIYEPKPDFRFTNDSSQAVLIQTKIQGDDLIFEFWGTKDGRQTITTDPRIYNIVKPPPTKIISTEDLPVGQKKCTESAHNGADAEFTYTVTYPDGQVKEEVFKSHYVPWQEVCLVGVAKGTLSTDTKLDNESVLPDSSVTDNPATISN